MRSARDEGITSEEMEDAVLFLGGSMARQVETNAGMAATLLNQEIFGLGDDYYLRFESILRDLSLDEVNSALAEHLRPDSYHLAVAGPDA
jgi:predicted Zn-dependent peptidase